MLRYKIYIFRALLAGSVMMILYGSSHYLNHFYTVQIIGNYIDSNLSNQEKSVLGDKFCKCDSIDLKVDELFITNTDMLIDSLIGYEFSIKKLLYFTLPRIYSDPNKTTILPKTKYYKARVSANIINGEIKQTGGMIDHIDSDRYSFRIKTKDTLILGSTKMNFYNPKCRFGGIYEWVGHELLDSAGLISLKTGYLNITINNIYKGLYFYQEQPTLKTIEDNNRAQGLIIRLVLSEMKDQSLRIENIYDKGSFDNRLNFKMQYRHLSEKIMKYNNEEISAQEIFSMEALGKYCSIIDLINGYHALELRNYYFYFNPKDSLLEPIGREFNTSFYKSIPVYNGLGFKSPIRFNQNKYISNNFKNMVKDFKLDSSSYEKLFGFYIKELVALTSPKYLESFFDFRKSELKKRQYCLYKSNPKFKTFEDSHYYKNRNAILRYLKTLK